MHVAKPSIVMKFLSAVTLRVKVLMRLLSYLIVLVAELRAAVFLLAAVSALVYWTDQFGDVIDTHFQSCADLKRLARSLAFILFAAILSVICSSGLLSAFATREVNNPASRHIRRGSLGFRLAPTAIGLVFLWGPLIKFIAASGSTITLPRQCLSILQPGVPPLVLLVLFLAFGSLVLFFVGKWELYVSYQIRAKNKKLKTARYALLWGIGPITVVGINIILLVYLRYAPKALGAAFGPIVIFYAAVWLYLVVLSILQEFGDITRFPFIAALVLFALVSSSFGWFNSYRLSSGGHRDNATPATRFQVIQEYAEPKSTYEGRLLAYAQTDLGLLSSQKAFSGWLNAQQTDDMPMFIVNAQGGGFYAAYHSALALARLQDRCPLFADKLFALTGVSGGSLGVSVFLAAVHAVNSYSKDKSAQRKCTKKAANREHEQLVVKFFESDFLTPMLAAGLLLDLPDHFVPFKSIVSPKWIAKEWPDRAKALERAIIDAWEEAERHVFSNASSPNFFSRSIYSIRRDTLGLPFPAFGVTIVETGELLVLSPLLLMRRSPETEVMHHLVGLDPNLNPSVAQSVVLSARFPGITPPATVTNSQVGMNGLPAVIRVIDGGFFENSGMKLTREIIDDLRSQHGDMFVRGESHGQKRVKLNLIAFSHQKNWPYSLAALSEVSAAAVGLLNAKTTRGFDYIREVRAHLFPLFAEDIIEYQLADRGYNPPLGWIISNVTRAHIAARSGFFADYEWNPVLGTDPSTTAIECSQTYRTACAARYNHSRATQVLDKIPMQ